MNIEQMVEALTGRRAMPDQDRYDYEVMREAWELENPWWLIQCGTAEEARGDYDHDVQRQRELDEEA